MVSDHEQDKAVVVDDRLISGSSRHAVELRDVERFVPL
jgi:hypothetical protein